MTRKQAGRVTQVIECLPSKHEALSSSPSTTKRPKPTNQANKKKWQESNRYSQEAKNKMKATKTTTARQTNDNKQKVIC
jgi:hypothetical protein